jgi:hypothetical protein
VSGEAGASKCAKSFLAEASAKGGCTVIDIRFTQKPAFLLIRCAISPTFGKYYAIGRHATRPTTTTDTALQRLLFRLQCGGEPCEPQDELQTDVAAFVEE